MHEGAHSSRSRVQGDWGTGMVHQVLPRAITADFLCLCMCSQPKLFAPEVNSIHQPLGRETINYEGRSPPCTQW